MHLIQLDGDRVASPDRGNFGTTTLSRNRDGALATHDVVGFGHLAVQVGTRRSTWRKYQVVHIGPRAKEDRRVEYAPILYRSFATAHPVHRPKQRMVQPHSHENRYGIEGHLPTVVAEVEGVVGALHRRHVDVHPLNRLIGGVVDRVGMPHPAEGAGGSF